MVLVLLRGRTLRSPGGACEPAGASSRFGALREGGGALTVRSLPKRLDVTMTYVV